MQLSGLTLLAISISAFARSSEYDRRSSSLRTRQSTVDYHKWENLFGNGPWCFFWCRGRGQSRYVPESHESPAITSEYLPSEDRGVVNAGDLLADEHDHKNYASVQGRTGGKIPGEEKHYDADGITKWANFPATPTITTKALAARHTGELPSEITTPATLLDATKSVVAATSSSCHPLYVSIVDENGLGECLDWVDGTPIVDASTTSTTSPSSSVGQATASAALPNAGERIVEGSSILMMMMGLCGLLVL